MSSLACVRRCCCVAVLYMVAVLTIIIFLRLDSNHQVRSCNVYRKWCFKNVLPINLEAQVVQSVRFVCMPADNNVNLNSAAFDVRLDVPSVELVIIIIIINDYGHLEHSQLVTC